MRHRIKQLRKFLKLSQTEFGKKLGKTLRMVQYYESGERNIDDGILLKLNEIFGADINWLRTGIGEIFSKQKYDNSSPVIRPVVTAGDRAVCVRYFPEVKASAGFGSLVHDETSEDYWLCDEGIGNPKLRAVISVVGDSMVPTLLDKDKILISIDTLNLKRLKAKHLYVVHTEGAVVVKRFIKRRGNIGTFGSDNDFYKNIEVDLSDEHNKIVGIPLKIVCRELQLLDDEDFIDG